MTCDITMVLYKPRLDELATALMSISRIRSEFSTLRILISGNVELSNQVTALLDSTNLSDRVDLVHRFDNVGFATGHNILLRRCFTSPASYALVLNPDVSLNTGALRDLLDLADGNALYGPSISRLSNDNEPPVADSLGIKWERSGRHFDDGQGQPWQIQPGRKRHVAGLTGACLLVPRAVHDIIVEDAGWFFDDAFLAYREDAELGVRATSIGIPSLLIELEGFSHARAVRGYTRGATLPDLLGVRNRFLLKWRLGMKRPGNLLLAAVRDAQVIVATILVERSSLPGLRSAVSIRRYIRNTRSPLRLRTSGK